MAAKLNKNEEQQGARNRPSGRRRLGSPLTRQLDEAEKGVSRPDS
jgi:hypothetical protein